MKKDSKGRVIASLTEVKNKTGDIFALVDQCGSVYLTSYNKIRYKIEKVSIESLLLDQHDKNKNEEDSSDSKPTSLLGSSNEKAAESLNINEVSSSDKRALDLRIISLIDINEFDLSMELDFVKQSIKPLI